MAQTTVRISLTLALAGAALLCALPALGQVNAEVVRKDPVRPGWAGELEASFALARGNIETLDIGGGGRIEYQTLHPVEYALDNEAPPLPYIAQRVFLSTNGAFAETGNTRIVSQELAHLRWTAMWLERLGSELFAQYQYNEFLRLNARMVGGVGARVDLFHTPELMAWGGTAYMLEYERIRVEPGAPDQAETLAHRSSSYVSVRLSLFGDSLFLQDTVYVQPRFDDLSNVRLLEELTLQGKVTPVLSLGNALSVHYDSAPPTGVLTTDLRLVSNVKVTF